MLNKSTITEKLVAYFLFLNITGALVVGLLSYINSKDAINRRTFEQLNSVKYSKKKQIENFFRDRLNEVSYFSRTGDLEINRLEANPESVKRFFAYFKYYKSLAICSKNGDYFEIFSNQPDSAIKRTDCLPKPFRKRLIVESDSIHIFEDIDVKSGRPYRLYLAAKIGKSNEEAFFVIDTQILNSIMLETNPKEGLGKTGESYIIGSDYYMRTRSRFFGDSIRYTKVQTNGAYRAINGGEGVLFYKDYRNKDVLGSFGPLNIPGLKWYIFAEIDLEETNQPIVANRTRILILTLIIAAIVFALTYIISRRMTIPILKLTEATKRIANGAYGEKLKLESSDEIGELTATFNDLSSALKEQRNQIERERLKRSQSAIEAMEKERQRLSRELHDGLGQTLISQKLALESINPNNVRRSAEALEAVKKSLDTTIDEVRHISADLMPAVLFEFGLVNAIRKLCKDLNEFGKMEIAFSSDFHVDLPNDDTKVYLFRITQEALKNSIKHSKATNCWVELKANQREIILKIKDNGVGFDKDQIQEGNGLINIRERVNLLNGQFKVQSKIYEGAELTVIVPIGGSYGKD
ncbi:MAG: histidine kinase [Chloroflexota bacterium]